MPEARRVEPVLDRWLLRRFTARPMTGRARLVRRVVPFADDLKPWLLLTPLLAVRRAGRGAVLRAWASVALASVAAKAVEALLRRERPGPQVLRERVVAGDEPASSSFPSTHTSSAVAFSGAIAASSPATGALLAPVVLFVGWSRVAGGRHYPSDILGGAAVGAAAAMAVAAACRLRNR